MPPLDGGLGLLFRLRLGVFLLTTLPNNSFKGRHKVLCVLQVGEPGWVRTGPMQLLPPTFALKPRLPHNHMTHEAGFMVPSTNSTAETDFVMAAPPGVTVHGQRMWLNSHELTAEGMDRMNQEVEQCARYLASAKVDYIVYSCTTGSFYKGPGYDGQIVADTRRVSGVPATTAALGCIQSLQHLGAGRLSVASPYNQWQNGRLLAYLEAAGFNVLNVEGEPNGAVAGAQGHNDLEPQSALEFAAGICRPEADALLCSCTAWRTLEVASELERLTEKPVITANQATNWAAFRELGLKPRSGFGSLLDTLAAARV